VCVCVCVCVRLCVCVCVCVPICVFAQVVMRWSHAFWPLHGTPYFQVGALLSAALLAAFLCVCMWLHGPLSAALWCVVCGVWCGCVVCACGCTARLLAAALLPSCVCTARLLAVCDLSSGGWPAGAAVPLT
jgi:hypothetical protein